MDGTLGDCIGPNLPTTCRSLSAFDTYGCAVFAAVGRLPAAGASAAAEGAGDEGFGDTDDARSDDVCVSVEVWRQTNIAILE